jgi:hypothetical protein
VLGIYGRESLLDSDLDEAGEHWYPCEWRHEWGPPSRIMLTAALGVGIVLALLGLVFFDLGPLGPSAVALYSLMLFVYYWSGYRDGAAPYQRYQAGRLARGEYAMMRGLLFLRVDPAVHFVCFKPEWIRQDGDKLVRVKGRWWQRYSILLQSEPECEELLRQIGGSMETAARG